MAHEDWTVDRLHVALPHSASRQQLLQDVNLTPLEELPAVLEGWAKAAEQLEAARPLIETARRTASAALPLELEVRDVTADVMRDAEPSQGHGAGRGRGAA